DLVEVGIHARPLRLPAAVRADPLWLAAGQPALLVRSARPGGGLVGRENAIKRSSPDHEADRTGGAGHPQLLEDARHRARPLWRLWNHADGGGGERAGGGGGWR